MTLDDVQSDDLFNLVCGKQLGRGQYRVVFECRLNENWVVKQDSGENFSNISEWEIWDELGSTPLGRWLAPVEWVSARGLWLIQRRTEPLSKDRMPKRIPSLFADDKLSNWGWLDGRAVCHDYGNHAGYRLIRENCRLRPADWR